MAANSTTMKERLRQATDNAIAKKKEEWEFSFGLVVVKVESILMEAAKEGQNECNINLVTIEDTIKEHFSDIEPAEPIINKLYSKLTDEGLTVATPHDTPNGLVVEISW